MSRIACVYNMIYIVYTLIIITSMGRTTHSGKVVTLKKKIFVKGAGKEQRVVEK